MVRIPVYQVKLQKIGSFPWADRTITTPESAAEVFRHYLERYCHTDRESLIAMYLNTKNRVVGMSTVHTGSLDASIVHPREVMTDAILHKAAAVIVGHNHPSGNPAPSSADLEITKRLKEAGNVLGIDILDHIVFGENHFYSITRMQQFPFRDREAFAVSQVRQKRNHELER